MQTGARSMRQGESYPYGSSRSAVLLVLFRWTIFCSCPCSDQLRPGFRDLLNRGLGGRMGSHGNGARRGDRPPSLWLLPLSTASQGRLSSFCKSVPVRIAAKVGLAPAIHREIGAVAGTGCTASERSSRFWQLRVAGGGELAQRLPQCLAGEKRKVK
jgi:hypothetical protein